MKLKYFVNTMFMMEGKYSKVLCDPWITTDKFSRSGLYNFPKLETNFDDLKKLNPDYIYISHTHADHFDPDTLDVFDKNTPILVSWYKNNFTERAVKKLGFKDVRVPEKDKPLNLNKNDFCWIEPSRVYSAVDSIAVFEIDGYKVLNVNDSVYHEEQCIDIKKRFSKIDIACIPSGMQGPYPAFYDNLSLKEKEKESDKKKIKNYNTVLNYINIFQPKYFLPFTGGAVYAGKKALLMPYCGVGTSKDLKDYLLRKKNKVETILLSENCVFDIKNNFVSGSYSEHSYVKDTDYFDEISKIKLPFDKDGIFYINKSEEIDLSTLLEVARKKQEEWQKRLNINLNSVFFIDVGQQHLYRLCLSDSTVKKVKEENIEDKEYEIFRMPYSLLIALLTRHYNYSNIKTQFINFYRKPDIFNPNLHILMSHLHL